MASVTLRAEAGDVDLGDATTSAQREIHADASGTLRNDRGTLSSQAGTTMRAGSLSNRRGRMSAGGPLTIDTSGQVANQGGTLVTNGALELTAGDVMNNAGTIQSDGALSISGASLVNTAGRIASLNADGLSLSTTGQLTNAGGTAASGARGGVIGGNGDVSVQAGSVVNRGSLTALQTLQLATALLDNREGAIAADRLNVKAANLQNTHGALTQYGDQATTLDVSGALDNSNGGTIRTNGVDLTLAPSTLNNAGGKIVHAGTGTLKLAPAAGTLTNVGGTMASRGGIALSVDALDNAGGVLEALGSVSARIAGELSNMRGALTANGDMTLDAGTLTNTQDGKLSGANARIRAGGVNNDGGRIASIAGTGGDVDIATTGVIANAGGQIGATRNLSVTAGTLSGGGAYGAANNLTMHLQGDFAYTRDYRFDAGHDLAFTLPGTFSNTGGLMSVNNLGVDAGTIVNHGAMAAGGLLRTNSNTLTNTGTMVGGSVSLAAASKLENVGPTALIGASDSSGLLELLSQAIENRDDTTATDTPALTAIYGVGRVVLAGGKNASGHYMNAARILNRSGLVRSDGDMALHADLVTNTRRDMKTAWTDQVDPALLESLGISLSGRTGQVGVKDPGSIGGEYNSTYQYTTYTGKARANVIARFSPQARIVSGGKLDASSVGTLQNDWSAVAAAGDIAMPGALDNDSWRGQDAPRVEVTYTGRYWYRNYDGSKFWSYSFCNDAGCNGPADLKRHGLPDYASSFVSNGTLSGTGVSIHNPAGNATIPPIGLPPGVDIGAVGGGIDKVIATATAVAVLKNLTIPQGGLFHPNPAPDARYLIETNPAFTSQRRFMSSDYYLQQLGLNPDQTERRLGDGFHEQWLVRNQITALTGKAVLGPYTNVQAMYESLLGAGAALAKSLDLPLGMGLSAEQVSQLTGNVVLLETRVVDGQSVLVPVVYLAKADQKDMSKGPLIAADNIDLKDVQSFTNSGAITASGKVSIDGKQIDNRYGTLQSGGHMALATRGDVDLTSANVKASSLQLQAGGNLLLDTAPQTQKQVNADGATRVTTTLGPTAHIDVTGDAAIGTGGDFRQNAGALSAGGNLGMQIGGDWTLGAQEAGEKKVAQRSNGVSDTDIRRAVGSSVKVGGASAIAVGGDLTAHGAQIDLGGGGAIAAGGNVTLGAARTTSTVNSSSAGNEGSRSYAETYHTSDQTLTGTTLTGGDSVAIVAGKDLNVIGSAISLEKGNATLAAAGDVNIGAATETHELNAHETHSRSGVVSGSKVASGIDQTMTLNRGSLVSADGVTIASGRDLDIQGSTVVGTNDVTLNAARNATIATTRDTLQSSSYYEKRESGLMSGGGLSVSVGSSSLKTTSQTHEITNNGSTIGSLNGNLSISAGNDLHVTGSDLIAARNISGTGANVTIDAAQDTSHRGQTQEISKSGLTLALKAPVIDAVSNAVDQSRAASKSQDGRAAALHGTNQGAYDRGQQQLGEGQTYNELVTSNIKKDPVGATVAGAGMIGLGIVTAGGIPTLAGMATGGSIGAVVNIGAQYVFNDGKINFNDVVMAGVTGALTFGTGFLPGLLMNTGGALTGSALQGINPNIGMAGAAAGSLLGYGAGGKIEGILNNKFNPWYRPEWVELGLGVSKYVPPSVLPSVGGTIAGAVGLEGAGGSVNTLNNRDVLRSSAK
ncbi:hemagglutinin repeat-containing protein [Burkholderia sp. F1]